MPQNPFKYGTIVEDNFFTDRIEELAQIGRLLDSENHIVLISPRRFGKTSLIHKAVLQSGRPCVWVNLQSVTSANRLAAALLQQLFKFHPWQQLKYELSHFRVVPVITASPVSDKVEVSFQTASGNAAVLEDVLTLTEKMSKPEHRIVVVLDEFQEIAGMEKGLDKRLRAVMQTQSKINYIILGSQESMMTEIFERKKSPFYHFGQLLRLKKIPRADFMRYVQERLAPFSSESECLTLTEQILAITDCHPYYTQQLASQVWNLLAYEQARGDVVSLAVEQLTEVHDLDFERLWVSFNKTDKYIVQCLCLGKPLFADHSLPASTRYSAVKRLMRLGYVIKGEHYEVEDPFFRKWVINNRL